MKGKKGSAQELVQVWEECKCRRRSSVKGFFTRRVPVLLLLAVGVGAACGLRKLDGVSTACSAFVVGFCTVAWFRRGARLKQQKLGESKAVEVEIRKGTTTLLDSTFDDDFIELFNALEGRSQSSVWISPEARIEWEKKAQAYAKQLGGIAAEAQNIAARLKSAARQAHAYADSIAPPGVPDKNVDASLRIVATGDSGMSTRSNALFEDFGLGTEDPASCRSVSHAVLPEGVLVAGFKELQQAVSQTADKLLLGGIGPGFKKSDEDAAAAGGGIVVPTQSGLAGGPTKVEDKIVDCGTVAGRVVTETPYYSTELSNLGKDHSGEEARDKLYEEIVRQNSQVPTSALGVNGLDHEEVCEVVPVPDSLLQAEEASARSRNGWSAGNQVFADMFEPIASEEASLRTGEVQPTSLRPGLPGNEASLTQVTVTRTQGLHKRSVNLENWAEGDLTSVSEHEDDFSSRTSEEAAEHVSRVGSDISLETTSTDISLLAVDAGSAGVSPVALLSRRTASFRETGTERKSASTEYGKTSKHRVSKSDGDFLFRNSLDGSASERENASSVTSSPTRYGSFKVHDVRVGSGEVPPQLSTRRPNRGIASRLKGALTSKRFSSSRVVPGRDDVKPSSGSRRDDKSKAVTPKREDVFKVNRIPSTEAASKVEANPKALGNPARRRLS